MTIGDYWDIYVEHGEELKQSRMSNAKGISCLLVNTKKGAAMAQRAESHLEMFATSFDKVARHNAQLHSPSVLTEARGEVMRRYRQEGYAGVERISSKRIA